MPSEQGTFFCGTELAARIERVETELISTGSTAASERLGAGRGFVIPLAGGVAAFAEDGSPLNKVAGLGFAGVPEVAELEEIERLFAERNSPVQAEVSQLGDPGVGELLTGRGYRLVSFENVLGLELDGERAAVVAEGVDVQASGDDEFDAWLDVVAEGFAHPDAQGVASHEQFPAEVIANAMRDLTAAAGIRRYLARRGGEVAGGASLRMSQGVAQLTGAATHPAHRRHGVQSSLLSVRLADATAAGCDIAVVTTQPGSKSQQNVQRQGFALLYTRAILVKD
ncbi:GNAT family N-acetyltransferase [Nocardia yunnanensis]|uniref:GNAT family N-acetyltransferase n=1 Tax=Nocardia yunnanensis TaxID=2382165 RepID=A0A386Z765_9NOCA|nr:GNAT family N-acetyltransferase [Nocardia yunnanensis]AYF73446.1 GNAT family N-acetyltransferase [Nocardia yunnanensis]